MRPGRGPGLRARGAAHSQRSSSKETTRSRSKRERDAPSSEAVDELFLGVVAHVHRRDVVLDEAARLGRRVDVARRHALVVGGDVAQRRVGRADARPAVPLPVVAVVVGLLVRQHCRGSGSNVSPSPFRSERVRGREREDAQTPSRAALRCTSFDSPLIVPQGTSWPVNVMFMSGRSLAMPRRSLSIWSGRSLARFIGP